VREWYRNLNNKEELDINDVHIELEAEKNDNSQSGTIRVATDKIASKFLPEGCHPKIPMGDGIFATVRERTMGIKIASFTVGRCGLQVSEEKIWLHDIQQS
jgi:hypothetical protein